MENYKIRIYPTAKKDLQEVVSYLNTLSPDAALRYYDLLVERIPKCRSDVRIRVIWHSQQRDTGICW